MITNIYFVRHAHSTYTPDELNRPLSESGLKDARKVTQLLSEENITHVVSSPYKRAIQTVEGIAKELGLNILIEDDFRERRLADHSVDHFEEVILRYWEDFNFHLSGGESGYGAQERGIKSLESILDSYRGGNIVIGTHGNIMVLMMNYYDPQYHYDFWRNLDMPDIYKLSFEDKKLLEVKRICT
ncbi:histidine phosphatase family protein [Alkaliphilus hydrothermalis]|uniref:2,3-bisphosphoglycerate-dependent phosphoglycerate mutase n=1 Tax=Alkaliphilus hydrothermalis TaxID=1482730 RepID=A0ABS2NSM1_9FIRM|nr:histidine phosphatase family protein [Alkaliphilus hydrothermalis]MBM7615964.1 2,3-bisphosphoglycerate-dependent phosphoglycerate mutase [Alkaliphilus hydrothermalis]